jgi:hypothetical protein
MEVGFAYATDIEIILGNCVYVKQICTGSYNSAHIVDCPSNDIKL